MVDHPLIKAIESKMATLRDLDYEIGEIAPIFAEFPSEPGMTDPITDCPWRWHALDDDKYRREWKKVSKSDDVYRANVTTATGLHSVS